MPDLILPLDAFVRAIGVDRQTPHAIFLGAGASISSGIPSAGLCILEWKRSIFLTNNPGVERQFSELTLRSVQERIQKWLDGKGVYPANGSPEEYSFYIEKCYPISQHRRLYFADKVRVAQPHIGYRLLSLMAESDLIASTWTTNFDGMVAKAAANFRISPIEVGIDTQARAIRQSRQGELLCVSLHGDYRYDKLKNTDSELQQQEAMLEDVLVETLEKTPLIVLGYSGRDTSIMQALEKAYSRPGPASLYWCGYGDEISEAARRLLQVAQAAGRAAYFVPTTGFDDTLARLALHCLSGNQQERARQMLSEISYELRNRNEPFSIEQAPCTALIKSNSFEIDCPSEVFAFGLEEWPEKPWKWVEELCKGKKFVAVPFRKKILALGLIDEIRDSIGNQLSGSIERTPITDSDTNYDDGAVNALMRRALLKAFADRANVATECKTRLWEKKSYTKKSVNGQECHIHRAVVIYLREFNARLQLVIKPTISVLDNQGNELDRNLTKVVKAEILGYEHNAEFNKALNRWRDQLLPTKGITDLEFPSNSGSTFRFRIRTAPQFAQIGKRSCQTAIPIDNRFRPMIKQQGIEIPEPKLQFSNRSGTQYTHDSHPLRGLYNNRPYDFSLTFVLVNQMLHIALDINRAKGRSFCP